MAASSGGERFFRRDSIWDQANTYLPGTSQKPEVPAGADDIDAVHHGTPDPGGPAEDDQAGYTEDQALVADVWPTKSG